MPLRVSPLDIPPESQPGPLKRAINRVGNAISWLLQEQDKGPAHPPVSEDAMVLARFIVANTTLARLKLVRATTPSDYDPTTVYSRSKVREYLHAERRSGPRTQPHAILTLSGRNYGSHETSDPQDAFYCKFGVFYVDDGSRIIQVAPYEWEGPSYSYEHTGVRASLAELFGDKVLAEDFEGYARIGLGVIDREGQHSFITPYNTHAFGADLVRLLDVVSAPGLEAGLDIQIHDNKVTQLN